MGLGGVGSLGHVDDDFYIDVKSRNPPDLKVEAEVIKDGVSTIVAIEDTVESMSGSRDLKGVQVEYDFQRKGNEADSPIVWDTFTDPKNPNRECYRFQAIWTVKTPDGQTKKFRQWIYTNTRVGSDIRDANFAHTEKYRALMCASSYCRTIEMTFSPTENAYNALQSRINILRNNKIMRMEFVRESVHRSKGEDPSANPIKYAMVFFGDAKGKHLSVDFAERVVKVAGQTWTKVHLRDADESLRRGPQRGELEYAELTRTKFVSTDEVADQKGEVGTTNTFLKRLHEISGDDEDELQENLKEALFSSENFHPGGVDLSAPNPHDRLLHKYNSQKDKDFIAKRSQLTDEQRTERDWTVNPLQYQAHVLDQARINCNEAQAHAERLTKLLAGDSFGVTNYGQASLLKRELKGEIERLDALADTYDNTQDVTQRQQQRGYLEFQIKQLENIQVEYNAMVKCQEQHTHFLKQYDAISKIISEPVDLAAQHGPSRPRRPPLTIGTSAVARGLGRAMDAYEALGTKFGPSTIAKSRNVNTLIKRLAPLRKQKVKGKLQPSHLEDKIKRIRNK